MARWCRTARRGLLSFYSRKRQRMPCIKNIATYAVRRPVRFFLTLLLLVCLLYVASIARFFLWPPVGVLAQTPPEITSFMQYRAAQWADQGRTVAVRWTWVSLDKISRHLRRAVVVAEDSTFWEHDGFDWEGMRIALERNLAEHRFSAGGSTITQQLAKNLYLSPDRSIRRKLQEAVLAWRIERALDKNRILELYLNVVEWGDGIYGAEAAARHYFGVSAARLSPRQAATLAAMLPAPLRRTPDSPHVRRLSAVILRRM